MTERATNPSGSGQTWTRWTLQRGLPAALALLTLAQIACWVPHYLTWPYYADHDVFASLAQDWDAGRPPYRDAFANNLPGTIYLFYLVGKVFGWGRPAAFFAVDAALVAAFAGLMAVWGRKCFATWPPGLIGTACFLAYELDLTYALAAQRDGHAALFGLGGLLVTQAWPGRSGRVVSACLMATALLFRPQAVVFLPAYGVALASSAQRLAWLEWTAVLVAGVMAGLAPLAIHDLLGDLAASLRLTAPGSSYNRTTPTSFVTDLLKQANATGHVIVPLGLLLLWPRGDARLSAIARVWLAATAGTFIYKPMSPFPHVYLDHPLRLVLAVDAALLVALALRDGRLDDRARLLIALLALAPTVAIKPQFANPGGSLQALADLRRGGEPEAVPNGYRPTPGLPAAAYYPWDDYRATLAWVRAHTTPATRVANMLQEVPAIVGPTGRRSVFPAESIAWLKMVRRSDEARFAEALDAASDAIVVWIPGEVGLNTDFRTPLLDDVVRRRFRLERRFGQIEVWVLAEDAR